MDELAVKLAVAVLAAWRLAAMLWYEHGPGMCWDRLRGWVARRGAFWADQVECFWCVSLWAALLVLGVAWLWWWALLPLALSGAVLLLSGGGRIIWHEIVNGGE